MDGRLGGPFSLTLPRPGQTQVFGDVTGTTTTPDGPVSVGLSGQNLDGMLSLALGPSRPAAGFYSQVSGIFARLDTNGRPDNSPDVHNLSRITKGRMTTGANHLVRDRDLARVVSRHAVQDTGNLGVKGSFAIPPGTFAVPASASLLFALPFTRTEYYNTDGGGRWLSLFYELTPDVVPQSAVLQDPQDYRADRTYREDWNRGVFGPAVGRPADPFLVSTRTGDLMHLFVPTHGDGSGRTGLVDFASGRTTVFKDGVPVAEASQPAADFTVPAAQGLGGVGTRLQRRAPAKPACRVLPGRRHHLETGSAARGRRPGRPPRRDRLCLAACHRW